VGKKSSEFIYNRRSFIVRFAFTALPPVLANVFSAPTLRASDRQTNLGSHTAMKAALKATRIQSPPLKIDSWMLDPPVLQPLMLYGIFNPFGPTLSSLSLIGLPDAEKRLIAFAMLNPFSQEYAAFGAVRGDPAQPNWVTTQPDLVATCQSICRANGSGDIHMIAGAPTFIVLTPGLDVGSTLVLYRALLSNADDLGTTVDSIRRHPNDPWERARQSMTSMLQEAVGKQKEDTRSSMVSIDEYLAVVASKSHWSIEIPEFIAAWQGSIDFQAEEGSAGLSSAALPPRHIQQYLVRMVTDPKVNN